MAYIVMAYAGQSRFLTFTICDEDLKSAPNGHPMVWGAPQVERTFDSASDGMFDRMFCAA